MKNALKDSIRSVGVTCFVRGFAIAVTVMALSTQEARAQKVTTTLLPEAKVAVAYAFQLQGQGGKLPYRWYSASSLPSGISLAQTGYLFGTPTTPGAYTLSLKLVTANNKTVSKTLTLTIAPSVPLRVTTLTLPDGVVGTPYSAHIDVEGGTPPYRCDPEPDNNLAEFGLVLDPPACLVFGTPIKAGQVHF